MSRDSSTSSVHVPRRTENEFEGSRGSASALASALLPPSRSPLNSIPDPSQCHKELPHLDLDFKQKLEAVRARRLSERKGEVFDRAGASAGGSAYSTPKVSSRAGKAHAESSSAQSTPARTGSRVSLPGPRGGRGLSFSSRDPRGVQVANVELPVECPHFELEENSSFWKDHNVQVLIRIRPLSSLEKVSQGFVRCLKQESAQTLLWLGHPETRFTFDHVACETISQENLFRVAGLPMVENCLAGYNSCMFAYGQTGSGKTYTMMGEINEVEEKLNEDCGITARIFEYLFERIRADEESRRDDKLMYSCKCSFLEIYNEQITDLLEPSSTNLQLREDMKKGVYVENLTEYNVRTVGDVVKLLLQGAANRKIAATRMNGESSRSHSVFTCIIESSWEKDSMNHFRFARLNLVDLAGSERQKSSGAEGDRLKEAANINKSLSTLGLVIMTLVDLAHGKQRHVPYRDSRLTFLLQDSLGGNSKTMIIANVSPSICSANETLSTLKFAQRAKLIQNNAKVNEDASGDVTALQRQIQQLKGQLSFLLEHQNPHRSLLEGAQALEISSLNYLPNEYESSAEGPTSYTEKRHCSRSNKSIEFPEGIFASSLRRERNKEMKLDILKAEIKHMSFLARQKEEDAERTKAILKLREEKIQRLEMLVNYESFADKYLMEENKALGEEIQVLRERNDNNPELIQLTMEKNKLLQELKLYRYFYSQGERETLLAEISELRNQPLEVLEGNTNNYSHMSTQDLKNLQVCQEMNFQLIREVEELRKELQKSLRCSQSTSDTVVQLYAKDDGKNRETHQRRSLEVISLRGDSEEEMASYTQRDECSEQNRISHSYSNSLDTQNRQIEKELMNAKEFIEAMEAEQFRLMKELQQSQEENEKFKAMLGETYNSQKSSVPEPDKSSLQMVSLGEKSTQKSEDGERKAMKARLDRIVHEIEEVTSLNNQYEQERKSQLSRQRQAELVCEQVEMETSRTILQLQEEVATLQLELRDNLGATRKENLRLRELIAAQQEELKMLSADWENATMELTSFLLDGSRSLRDVSRQIVSISGSFPGATAPIAENVEKAAIACIEKEETLLLLQRNLEEAQRTVFELEQKLGSLKGATIALSELQNLADEDIKGALEVNIELQENNRVIKMLKDQTAEAEKRVFAAFLVVKWLSDHQGIEQKNHVEGDIEAVAPSIKVCSFEKSLLWSDCSFMKIENGSHVLHKIKDELAQTNHRLCALKDSIDIKFGVDPVEGYSIDHYEWSGNYSTLGSDSDNTSAASESTFAENSCSSASEPVKMQKNSESLGQMYSPANISELTPSKPLNSPFCTETMASLRKELQIVYNMFNKQYVRLDAIISGTIEGADITSRRCDYSLNSEPCSGIDREEAAHEKFTNADNFLMRLEETNSTIEQACLMLNELTRANENAKYMSNTWKQTSEILMAEKDSMLKEVEHLKSFVYQKEVENEILKGAISHAPDEIEDLLSSLEGCFKQIQQDMDEMLKAMHSDVLSLRQDMLGFLCSSKSSMEDLYSEVMEKSIAMFVVYQCHVEYIIRMFPVFSREAKLQPLECLNRHQLEKNTIFYGLSGPNISCKGLMIREQNNSLGKFYGDGMDLNKSDLTSEKSALLKELGRKEDLLKGLLFDFGLLQESASNTKMKLNETEKMLLSLCTVEKDLDVKTSQLDEMMVLYKQLEDRLAGMERDLNRSESDLEQANRTVDVLSDQNEELRALLKDLYLKKSEVEEKLDEQKEIVKGLEEEILHSNSLIDTKVPSSVEIKESDLKLISNERDQLLEEVYSLNNKLQLAYALADENEAVAVEARQESETSKIYAEQKEEEVKILEHSIEELEHTINMLEKKVHEMDQDVERHRQVRDMLELELQALRQRLSTFEDFRNSYDSESTENCCLKDQVSGKTCGPPMDLQEARKKIKLLEDERAEQEKEIKRCKEYMSELVLHAEAQASQYQHKYKELQAMFHEVKADKPNSTSMGPLFDRNEKCSTRTRGSSSPFRCISSIVHQMNTEKDQELSVTKQRLQELEALTASQEKEVCVLNTRLAAAENMTHDVIRDLLGVKLDITNYANFIEEHQVQKLVVTAFQQKENLHAMEQEVQNLRKQVEELMKERESSMMEANKKQADVLAAEIALEQLQQRDQLLSAQNEMLKVDKSNLKRRVAELDEMVKALLGTQNAERSLPRKLNTRDGSTSKGSTSDLSKRLAQSDKLLNRSNDESTRYRSPSGTYLQDRSHGNGIRRLSSISKDFH